MCIQFIQACGWVLGPVLNVFIFFRFALKEASMNRGEKCKIEQMKRLSLQDYNKIAVALSYIFIRISSA